MPKPSQQPIVTMIFEHKTLSSMDLSILFEKLQEHEMELKKIIDDEEGDKNKKIPTLKVEEDND